jgi:hypothetical protein
VVGTWTGASDEALEVADAEEVDVRGELFGREHRSRERHVAAVAAAHHRDLVGCDVGVLDADVVIVQPRPGLAVAGRPAHVRDEHDVVLGPWRAASRGSVCPHARASTFWPRSEVRGPKVRGKLVS